MMSKCLQKADLIISGGAVFNGLEDAPQPGAVAVRGCRIVALGSRDDLTALIGPETKVHHFDDQLIIPGFHDFHVHLQVGSLGKRAAALHEARSEEEAAQWTAAHALEHPDHEWIVGFGWHHYRWADKKLPTRQSLDRVLPDRPAFLVNMTGHGAWVNSKALEICGIDHLTPDPEFGRIDREEGNFPSGYLFETALALAAEKALALPARTRRELFQGFLEEAARYGVTSLNDIQPLPGVCLDDSETYAQFEAEGRLTVRIHLESALGPDLATAEGLQKKYRSEKLRYCGLKQFLDGIVSTHTAYLLEPYADRPDYRGSTLTPEDRIRDWAVAADGQGHRLRLHAVGDAAVRLALDIYAEARRVNGLRDARHAIEHLEVTDPRDLPRLGELGVVASLQPEHLAVTPLFKDNPFPLHLGPRREPYFWVNQSLVKAGARIAYGTDYPVTALNPFPAIYRAVTRLHDDGRPEGGWNPREKVTLAQALSAYTRGSAYASFREHDLGTLEVGKLADLVVVDRNLFAVKSEEIREAKAILTVFDGRVIHDATGVS